jgi:hypothetical protein
MARYVAQDSEEQEPLKLLMLLLRELICSGPVKLVVNEGLNPVLDVLTGSEVKELAFGLFTHGLLTSIGEPLSGSG